MSKNATPAIDELYEKKAEVYGQMKSMMEVNQGDWSPEDEEKFDRLDGEITELDETIQREESHAAREARMRLIEEHRDRQRFEDRTELGRERAERAGRVPGHTKEETRSLGFAAWCHPSGADQERQFAAKQLGINQWSKEINVQCFFPTAGAPHIQAYQCPDMGGRIRKVVEERALGVSTPSAGGYVAPEGMMQALEIALLRSGAPRQYSTVVRTATGNPVPWPTTNDTANVGRILGENVAATEKDVTFGQRQTSPHMYSSDYVKVSIQLMQDSPTSIPGLLGDLLGTRIGRIQAAHFTTGDAASKPEGILTGAADSAIVLAADNAPNLNNIIDLKHSVDPEYRQGGHGFLLPDTIVAAIKKIVADGQPLWQAGLASGEPNTIDGDPYFVNQQVPTATATGTKSMAYGQLNKYIIHDALDLQIRRLDELGALENQVWFLAYMRSDGLLLDAGTNPVKYATNP